MPRIRVMVDPDLCIGAASCVTIAPETFQLNEENKAWVFDHGQEPEDRHTYERWLEVTDVLTQHLDGRNKFVGGSDGREYPYDKLLIATGGEVRSLDEDLRGVSYFRTLDDADHFLQLVTEQGSRARGVVYGGGFIACEYINLFQHFRIPTTVVHRGSHFWTRSFLPEAGELIAKTLRSSGVE